MSEGANKATALLCDTPNCGKVSKLRCPTCIKANIKEGSNFCSQVSDLDRRFGMMIHFIVVVWRCFKECFTKYWGVHKQLHQSKPAVYEPWPGYKFTGPLRPFPWVRSFFFRVKISFVQLFYYLKSAPRTVPPHIPRPDYADHPEGHPLSELAERGKTTVKVLDEEEIEGLRLACKVFLFLGYKISLNFNIFLHINIIKVNNLSETVGAQTYLKLNL